MESFIYSCLYFFYFWQIQSTREKTFLTSSLMTTRFIVLISKVTLNATSGRKKPQFPTSGRLLKAAVHPSSLLSATDVDTITTIISQYRFKSHRTCRSVSKLIVSQISLSVSLFLLLSSLQSKTTFPRVPCSHGPTCIIIHRFSHISSHVS